MSANNDELVKGLTLGLMHDLSASVTRQGQMAQHALCLAEKYHREKVAFSDALRWRDPVLWQQVAVALWEDDEHRGDGTEAA